MIRKTMILSILVFALAAVAAAWFGTRSVEVAKTPALEPAVVDLLTRAHSPVLGSDDAPVTIVEFFDPANEACRAFYPVINDILAEHGNAVRVVIRYAPFHGEASEEAIRVLEVARMQDVFEPVLEAILLEQAKWASHGAPELGLLLQIATSAGLDAEAAQAQILAPQIKDILNQDRADVEALGVRETPTFFVNGKPLNSFDEADVRALVAAEVSAAKS